MEIIRKLLIPAIFFVSMPVFAADHTIAVSYTHLRAHET